MGFFGQRTTEFATVESPCKLDIFFPNKLGWEKLEWSNSRKDKNPNEGYCSLISIKTRITIMLILEIINY